MGLEDADLVDDGDAARGGKAAVSFSCSICLEVVTDNGDRAWAKLQCGHQFHLDCIGSAFNVKGVMQCPNCRKIEQGKWLYANGSPPYPEFSMDDRAHDEDLYDLSYSESALWTAEEALRTTEEARLNTDEARQNTEELRRVAALQAQQIQKLKESHLIMSEQMERLTHLIVGRDLAAGSSGASAS